MWAKLVGNKNEKFAVLFYDWNISRFLLCLREKIKKKILKRRVHVLQKNLPNKWNFFP